MRVSALLTQLGGSKWVLHEHSAGQKPGNQKTVYLLIEFIENSYVFYILYMYI